MISNRAMKSAAHYVAGNTNATVETAATNASRGNTNAAVETTSQFGALYAISRIEGLDIIRLARVLGMEPGQIRVMAPRLRASVSLEP